MKTSHFTLLLFAFGAWGLCLRADEVVQPNESTPEADKTPRTAFTPLIAAHLSRAIASGVDRYGSDKTDLWLSSIDVVNGGLPEDSTPQRRRWYRSIHSPRGSNLYWDQPLIVAAHALSEQTGDEQFAAAADRYVRDFLKHCVAKETGLFLWGNHLYYHVIEDRPVGFSGGHHEMRLHTAAWDVFWRIDREATQRQIQAMFQQHVMDKTSGRFDRHANPRAVLRGASSRSMPFLEAGAVLVESLAWLAGNDKENMSKLTEQALLVARYSYDQRDRKTGLLRNQPSVRRWDYSVCTSEIFVWAGSFWP